MRDARITSSGMPGSRKAKKGPRVEHEVRKIAASSTEKRKTLASTRRRYGAGRPTATATAKQARSGDCSASSTTSSGEGSEPARLQDVEMDRGDATELQRLTSSSCGGPQGRGILEPTGGRKRIDSPPPRCVAGSTTASKGPSGTRFGRCESTARRTQRPDASAPRARATTAREKATTCVDRDSFIGFDSSDYER